jgi:cardiolipin synthase
MLDKSNIQHPASSIQHPPMPPDALHPTWQWLTISGVLIHIAIQLGIGVRVVMRKRPTGETLAWIMIVFTLPVIGFMMYLFIGELRLGRRRARRFIELTQPIKRWLATIPERAEADWSQLDEVYEPLANLCERTVGVPALVGNQIELISQWQEVFNRLLADINAASSTCHLEFYIWNNGGEADRVADALIRAVARGVSCRVLIDDLGSDRFLRSDTAARMRAAGVEVVGALPGGLLRLPFVRFDLRLHRKIVVIDGRIAYTGSLNLVDPRYFKRDAGVGQWIDAMVRIEGPAVEALQITFLADWYVETEDSIEELQQSGDARPQPRRGDCALQVLPSGPGLAGNAVEHVLLQAVYAARTELVLTTPYFLPSEALSMALVAAARRGVKVILVIPKRVDSALVRYASGTFITELLQAGVRIAHFQGGLLHTKSVSVDGLYSLFGSVNLDPRSLRLNFEILLAIYDSALTEQLRALQQQYLDDSQLLDLAAHLARPWPQQALENFARLLGPLL